jgi:hypothetical protein
MRGALLGNPLPRHLVAEADLKYFVDRGGADDQPFPVRVRNGGTLLCLPYQFDVNDGINFRFNQEGEAFARATIELFDQSRGCGAWTTFEKHLSQFRVGKARPAWRPRRRPRSEQQCRSVRAVRSALSAEPCVM